MEETSTPRIPSSSDSPATHTTVAETDAVEDAAPLSQETTEASQPFVGRWNRLVSTTNWEKGRIIAQWRDELAAAEAPASEYADEAWARLVGGVTGQHVGRLRRVYQRFGETFEQYEGLYWSHFQAALDWGDAEMWLEGAVQNGWSVSQTRHTRWETLGQVAGEQPQAADEVRGELDEDFEPARTATPDKHTIQPSYGEATGPLPEGPDFGDEEGPSVSSTAKRHGQEPDEAEAAPRAKVETVRPFAELGELPDDIADAFETFKLAILRHKAEGWKQISADELLGSLDALKELALAPSTDEAPF